MDAITGIIVAGGKGTRLGGCDKAFLEIGGEPVIVRTLRTLAGLFTRTIVVARHPERFVGIHADVTTDVYPGCGPLAGIHAGLRAVDAPYVFVVACDMPLLDAEVIRFLVDRIGPDPDQGPDAIVPWWDGDMEPLHAVYATRCLARIDAALARGDHSVRDFLRHVRVDHVPEATLARLAGAARSFTNVNTPDELDRLVTHGVAASVVTPAPERGCDVGAAAVRRPAPTGRPANTSES
jgi:molybdopterin-guanine dinucleotide biosynthesis protein A